MPGQFGQSDADVFTKRSKPEEDVGNFVWTRRGSIAGDVSDGSAASFTRLPSSSSLTSLVGAADGVQDEEEEAKRARRLARNRESARLRRMRKRTRVEDLTAKVRALFYQCFSC